jgi:transposase
VIEPLLPLERPKPKGGRPVVPPRAALSGILFVLRSGIPWEMLPREMGCGSGVTCWRRLRDWQEAGVWDRLHRELLRRLRQADRIDWSRACVGSASIAAKGGRRNRVEPDGPWQQGGHQAAPRYRPARHPARLPANRRQHPRQQALRRPARRRAACSRQARATPPPARQAARRQGMIIVAVVRLVAGAASGSGLRAAASRAARGWASIAGSSSAHSPRSTVSAA